MKKYISLFLGLSICAALASCSSESNSEKLAKLEQEYQEAYMDGDSKKMMKISLQIDDLKQRIREEGASSSDNPEISRLRENYIKACAEGDFETARKEVNKIEALTEDQSEINKHLKYVNDKEIYHLLANNSKDNANRVIYLYNTYESTQLPDMTDVLEVATSTDNGYLAKRLMQSGVNISQKAAVNAVLAGNSEVVETIIKLQPGLLANAEIAKFYKDEVGVDAFINTVNTNIDKIGGKAAIDIAVNENLKDLAVRLLDSHPDMLKDPAVAKYVKETFGDANLKSRLLNGISKIGALNVVNCAINNGFADVAVKAVETAPELLEKDNVKAFFEGRPEGKSLQTRMFSERLKKIRSEAPSIHAQGVVETTGLDYDAIDKENREVAAYNRKLEALMQEALAAGIKNIATEAANSMKPELVVMQGDSSSPVYHGFKVGYTRA